MVNVKGLNDVELCEATDKAIGEVRYHSAAEGADWFAEMSALSRAKSDLKQCEKEMDERGIDMEEVKTDKGLVRTYFKKEVVWTTER